MYTIKENSEYELVIKNSRFIASLHPITTKEDVITHLEKIKEKYPKATHYTYAYRTLEYEKSSDDGEPGGTAGMPILNVLQKEDITNILVIVIRYFGGIKLGAGGLVRAYSKVCRNALEEATLIRRIKGKKVKIETSYANGKELDYLLQHSKIIEKNFTDKLSYIVTMEDERILDGKFTYEIIEDDYIEKEEIDT